MMISEYHQGVAVYIVNVKVGGVYVSILLLPIQIIIILVINHINYKMYLLASIRHKKIVIYCTSELK